MLSFEDTGGWFEPGKCVVTGNPIRASLLESPPQEKGAHQPRRNVLVLGGSQGARALNEAVIQALPAWKANRVALWHQAGPREVDRVRAAYQAQGLDPDRVVAFIQDMGRAYRWADLVICRAGASTVAELTALGKASLLVPFPYAVHDHQGSNAAHLEQEGAAVVLRQHQMEGNSLARAVVALLDSPGTLAAMEKASGRLGRPEAGARIVAELARLLEGEGEDRVLGEERQRGADQRPVRPGGGGRRLRRLS
jgi:UDP-N-acetylglucosamine--N-acetylmuramyl-(pentapeptide) pyrophosphoryl-undecaprenol N-acetylglucosamine transferase